MSPPILNRGLTGLIKQGWNEIPEVMGASVFYFIGVFGLSYIVYDYATTDRKYRRFKDRYLVYRPDDPRLQYIKRAEDSPPITKL